MTETAASSQSATAGSATSARNQLKRALLEALAEGPSKLIEQIKYILELSQQVKAPAAITPPAVPLAPTTARVVALTYLAEHLSEEEVIELYNDLQRTEDTETRLLNTLRLALLLPPHYFQTIVHMVWQQWPDLNTPEARARVLLQLTPLLTLVDDEPVAPPILLEVVSLSQAIGNIEARIRALTALVPHLPHSMRVRALHRVIDEIDRLHNDAQRATALCALAQQLSPEVEIRILRSAESLQVSAERARVFTALARALPLPLQSNLRRSALLAISAISDEDERAGALIDFAPHLEYVTDAEHFPELLEQALGIALEIKRRHLRARVLVALAPHLTLDLQGETLAAVHSLNNERERAMMLSQLAPTLPANMLVASLAVAHSMQEEDARLRALTALAHHAPDKARERAMLDALATATQLPRHYERITALLELADVLPPHLQARAYADALDAAERIENDSACARSLSLISASLPPGLHERALTIARQIASPEHRLTALASIARSLPADQQSDMGDELLAVIRELPLEYKRAQAVGETADLLAPAQLQEALKITHDILEPTDRVHALTVLAPHLPADQRRQIVIECWRLIRDIDSGYDAANALSALAHLLPPSAANDLAHMAGMIIGSIMDEYDQASAIVILAPLLAAQHTPTSAGPLPDKYPALEKAILTVLEVTDPAVRASLLAHGAQLWVDICEEDQAYRLWQNVAQQLAALPAADTLLTLSLLSPVIRHLGGSTSAQQMTQVLRHYPSLTVADSD